MRALLLLVCILVLTGGLSGRQDEKKDPPAKSALTVGKDLPGPLNPFNVNGVSKKRFHDNLGPHGLDPYVLILTQDTEFSDELKKLLTALDTAIDKNPTARIGSSAVFFAQDIANVVTDDDARETLEGKLDALSKDLMLKHVILAIDSPNNVQPYKTELYGTRILMVNKLRLHALYGGAKLEPDVTPKIITELAEKFGAKRK